MRDTILILGRDTALASLIARTLRGQQIYSMLLPFGVTKESVAQYAPRGIILAAGYEQEPSLDELDQEILTMGVPVLALGAMTPALCRQLGGTAEASNVPSECVTMCFADEPLFTGIASGEGALYEPYYLAPPEDCPVLMTATERVVGFRSATQPLYALQFVIERNDPDAMQLLQNFACLVCGAEASWDAESIIADAISGIREQAGDGRVLCAVSGGVDSAVCAKLAHMAVGDKLDCVFIDTGLFRQDEPRYVIQTFMETLGLVVAYVDAQETFRRALSGVKSVREKERIASTLLQQVLYKQLTTEPDIHTLIMGTNFNDTLYGATPPTELPAFIGDQPLRVVEPIRELFKDEVRGLASELSLSGSIVERQPFPASGLALRILGEVTEEKLDLLRMADAYFTEEIRAGGHERKLWQYYATLTENPDDRSGYAVILRAVQAAHHSAYAARLPYDLLERVTERILREIPTVKRVVFDLTPSTHYATLE